MIYVNRQEQEQKMGDEANGDFDRLNQLFYGSMSIDENMSKRGRMKYLEIRDWM